MSRPVTIRLRLPCLLLLMALTLSGCQILNERLSERQEQKTLSPERDSPVIRSAIEEELDLLQALPADKRQDRYDLLRSHLQNPACNILSARLAMLYGLLSKPPTGDLPLLVASMERCTSAMNAPLPPGLVQILHGNLKLQSADADRIRKLEAQVQRERERNTALSEQMDALKAIEQSLRNRGQPPSTLED